mgnify:CR=1 FL=1
MNISDANVSVLKGVGTKMQKELENLSILTVRDLLEYFPRKYIDFSQISKIAELEPDVSVVVEATVVKKMRPFTAKGIRGGGNMLEQLVWSEFGDYIRDYLAGDAYGEI